MKLKMLGIGDEAGDVDFGVICVLFTAQQRTPWI